MSTASSSFIDRRTVVDWLGIAPFMIFALMFLIVPTLYLVTGAFFTPEGDFTFKNIGDLFTPTMVPRTGPRAHDPVHRMWTGIGSRRNRGPTTPRRD